MATREINDFRSESEFGAYNGDCWFAAVHPLLHCLDEARWPLGFPTLDALVKQAHAAGFAEANGAINVPHASAWLHSIGVAHETYCSYGGALPGDTSPWHPFTVEAFLADGKTLDPACFHAQLKTFAGLQGMGWERSAGTPLPGDEQGVVYHYISVGGIDTGPKGDGAGGAYLCADGDNAANKRDGSPIAAIRYTWAQIKAANPIGCIRITQPAVVVVAPPKPVPAPAPLPIPVPAPKVVTIALTPEQIAAVKAS